jgi:hypothetical protein
LSEETKALLNKNPTGAQLVRLNRLLLQDAYPQELARTIRWPVAWPWHNDALMGFWIILSCVTLCHVGLTGPVKQIGAMRYVYFLEGATFVAGSFLIARHAGLTGIIAMAILADLLWSGGYGFWRTARYFQISIREPLFIWLQPTYRYLVLLAPMAALLWWGTFRLPALARLVIGSGVMALVGLSLLWCLGLTEDLRQELNARFSPIVPRWARRAGAALRISSSGAKRVAPARPPSEPTPE